jgi:DNA-binding NarL/FixJ family response regulator
MRVVVADDAMLMRDGLAQLLRDAGVEVVATAADGDALRSAVALRRPDVAVIDIRMPPTHTDEGLVAAQRIRSEYPETAVLVLSQYLVPEYAMRLLEEQPDGCGYLLKDRVGDIAILIDALRRVAAGETVVDNGIVSTLFARRRRNDPIESLTGREREVLALVAQGLSNRAIGAQLFIADRTVESHIQHVFDKLGLPDDPTTNRRVLAALTALGSSRE